jgi:hypothetical protein
MRLKNRRGFTLLELLIAITLSIVIFVILFAALRLGHKSQAKGMEKSEQSQKLRILADRVSYLIRGVYPYYLNTIDDQKIFFDGKSDSAGFVTSSVDVHAAGPEDQAGLKWVYIFTDSEGLKIREKVFFLEDVFDDSKGNVYLIDPDVKKIEFEYYDMPEGEKQGSWVTEWNPDDQETVPLAVKVRMTLEQNGKKTELPELIVRISAQRKPQG